MAPTMPSTARQLPKWIAIVCLALCVATSGLWVRSFYAHDGIRSRRPSGAYWGIESSVGGLYLRWGNARNAVAKDSTYSFSSLPGAWEENFGVAPRRWVGIQAFRVRVSGERVPVSVVVISHWVVVLALSLPPTLWLVRVRRLRKRKSLGRCPECGYDLRSSRRRCPECGAIIQQEQRWWERIGNR